MSGGAAPDATAEIGAVLARLSPEPPPRGSAGAAVLAVLRNGAHDTEVLLIQRAVREDDRASGQIGLPGGHVEDRDASLTATAIRELEEEVGLAEADLKEPPRFLRLAPASVFSLTVAVFAAELGPAGRAPSAANLREVAHVFWLPVRALASYRRIATDTYQGRREVDAVVFDGHVLWGFTRRVLLDLFEIEPVEVA